MSQKHSKPDAVLQPLDPDGQRLHKDENIMLSSKELSDDNIQAPSKSRSLFSSSSKHSPARVEELKPILGKPLARLLPSAMVHFLPVSASIVLLALNFTHYFWPGTNEPKNMTSITNTLQFVAKLHEILTVASLTSMVLHHSRRHLLADGIPFGFLSSSYRLADIEMLTQPAFWSAFYCKTTRKLGLMVLIFVLLSVLIGPSAAIAYIPVAGYYPMNDAFYNRTGRILFFDKPISANTNAPLPIDMWPMDLSADIFGPNGCLPSTNCPTSSFGNVFQWTQDLRGVYDDYADIYEDESSTLYRAISSYIGVTEDPSLDGMKSSTAVASCPDKNLISPMGNLWKLIMNADHFDPGPVVKMSNMRLQVSGSSKIYEAVVQASCTYYGDSREVSNNEPRFEANGLLYFDGDGTWKSQTGTSWPVPTAAVDSLMKKPFNASNTYLTEWVRADDIGAADRLSIAALFAAPVSVSDAVDMNQLDPEIRLLIPCTFAVHWMPTTLLFDRQDKAQVKTRWTESSSPMVKAMKNSDQKARSQLPTPLGLISIQPNWANSLNQGDVTLKSVLDSAASQDMYEPRLNAAESDPMQIEDFMAIFVPRIASVMSIGLGSYGAWPTTIFVPSKGTSTENLWGGASWVLTGGISDMGSSVGIDPVAPPPATLPNTYEYEIVISRYGYAFGGAEANSVRFALTVICAYLFIFVSYVAYALWDQCHDHRYPIISWTKLQDLLALTMNSRPQSELQNCGANVKWASTWRQIVKARVNEKQEESKVELLFKDEPDFHAVAADSLYG